MITAAVRPSAPADAAGIAAVHVTSWREAYAHLLSQAFLDAIDLDARTQMWQGILDRHPSRVHVAAEDTPRARAFYARNGFQPDGERNVVEAWEQLAEVRLVR